MKNFCFQPIYIVGLPRSGTTWLASILNTAQSVKYFYEPFNPQRVPESLPHLMKYLRVNDSDPSFNSFCQATFSGRLSNQLVYKKMAKPYCRFGHALRWLPGRVMVKDVHSLMSLAWMQKNIQPVILVIIRHPCAVAASWFRHFNLDVELRGVHRIFNQPSLREDYLYPYQHLFHEKADFWQKIAVYWGAVYHVILQQQKQYPCWKVIRHEDLCHNPTQSFKELFSELNLTWTDQTNNLLKLSTSQDSCRPYIPFRISATEPMKWKKELVTWQIEKIKHFTQPFKIPYYSDFEMLEFEAEMLTKTVC
jgi:hypothetical protein